MCSTDKTYETVDLELKHFMNFLVNHLFIKYHNREYKQGKQKFAVKMNKFGDMVRQQCRPSSPFSYRRTHRTNSE